MIWLRSEISFCVCAAGCFIFHKELSSKERFPFAKIPQDRAFKEMHPFLAGKENLFFFFFKQIPLDGYFNPLKPNTIHSWFKLQ